MEISLLQGRGLSATVTVLQHLHLVDVVVTAHGTVQYCRCDHDGKRTV